MESTPKHTSLIQSLLQDAPLSTCLLNDYCSNPKYKTITYQHLSFQTTQNISQIEFSNSENLILSLYNSINPWNGSISTIHTPLQRNHLQNKPNFTGEANPIQHIQEWWMELESGVSSSAATQVFGKNFILSGCFDGSVHMLQKMVQTSSDTDVFKIERSPEEASDESMTLLNTHFKESLFEHEDSVSRVCVNPTNPCKFCSCSWDHKIMLWNLGETEIEYDCTIFVDDMVFDGVWMDSNCIVSACRDFRLLLHDLRESDQKTLIQNTPSSPARIDYSESQPFIIGTCTDGCEDGTALINDIRKFENPLITIEGPLHNCIKLLGHCICLSNRNNICIGYDHYFNIYSSDGTILFSSQILPTSAPITNLKSITTQDNKQNEGEIVYSTLDNNLCFVKFKLEE